MTPEKVPASAGQAYAEFIRRMPDARHPSGICGV